MGQGVVFGRRTRSQATAKDGDDRHLTEHSQLEVMDIGVPKDGKNLIEAHAARHDLILSLLFLAERAIILN